MAAVDRRNPNLDDFVGLNWSCWADRVDFEPADDTKYGRDRCETMTLRKEDMHIFGHCPAQDDFYLVVCSYCGKVVKPQAFEEHCERRHGALVKVCAQSNSVQHQQPTTCRQPSNVSRDKQRDRGSKASSVPTTTSTQRRLGKPQKESVSLPLVKNIPQDKPFSTLRPKSQQQPSRHTVPPVPSCPTSSSSSVKPTIQKPPESRSPQRETRTYSRLHKNINRKEQEVNKGLDQDKKKLILSQTDLTRKDKGKTDSDPPTLASTLPRNSEQPPVKTKATESLGAFSENPTSRCSKFALNTNNHIVRSRHASETLPEEDNPVEVEVQPPYPFNQSLPSSDEEQNDEEYNDLPTTSWHPKPLGFCTFGCRAFGCSIFTFDRRLHHLRVALSAMLEDHVNSHLWKKMPPPASNLRSHNATGARPNPSGSHSLNSTSLQRLQNKNTQKNLRRTQSPSSISNTNIAPGQQQLDNSARLSKTRPGQRKHLQNAKNTQKATHGTSSKHISTNHVSRKTPPLSPLRNTSILNESQQPKPSPKSRPPGIQPKVGSLDDRGTLQKRKSQSPAPTSSTQSKKCPRLSPPSRSNLFSWKRDSSQDVWLGVWRKEQTSEDDT